VFLIDDMRNGVNSRLPHGINEVRLRRGEIVREGMHTSLTELRRLGRKGWRRLCPQTAIFCVGREKAKLSYFWKHRYGRNRSGRYHGSLTNPDTGCPIETDRVRLTTTDFDSKRLHEIVEHQKNGTTKYCALWQADAHVSLGRAAHQQGTLMDGSITTSMRLPRDQKLKISARSFLRE
jgi:hypothetical protein